MFAMRLPLGFLVVSGLTFLAQSTACADSGLYATFAPRFEVTGTVRAVAVQGDNKSVIVGAFTTVNGVAREGIARLNADGTLDSSLQVPTNSLWINSFEAVALQADGKILVGGNFYVLDTNGIHSQYLVRLNTNGTVDFSFNAGSYSTGGLDNTVKAIAVDANGGIVIGGSFSSVHGVSSPGIARLQTNGSVDTNFVSGTGANGDVLALELQGNGKILVGGAFTTFNGTSIGRLCRLQTNGTLDSTFAPSGVVDGAVNAIAIQTNGQVIVGGTFTTVQGIARQNVARLGTNGLVDATFSIPNYFYAVNAVLVRPDNSILVGGWNPVMIFNNNPTDHNARLMSFDSTGAPKNVLDLDGKPTEVFCLKKRPDGKVVCGGNFRSQSGIPATGTDYRHGVCLVNDVLQWDATFAPIIAEAGTVAALSLQQDGKIMAVGGFNLVNGTNQPGVTRLNADGSRDTTFDAALPFGSEFLAASLQSNGKLVLGGTRLNTNGTLDTTFANSVGIHVKATLRQPDDKILVAGSSVAAQRGIVRLLTDGNLDPAFDVGLGLSNAGQLPNGEFDQINCLALQTNGSILVGGRFTTFNGLPHTNIVRLNLLGGVDDTFRPALFTNFNQFFSPEVFSIAVQPDGKVLVGGYFSTVGGVANPSLVRLNADGSLDTAFQSPFGDMGGTVHTLAVLTNNQILVGGNVQLFATNGTFFNSLFRLNSDGSWETSFAPAISCSAFVHDLYLHFSATVNCLLLTGTNQVLVGGVFTQIDGANRPSAARLSLGNLSTGNPYSDWSTLRGLTAANWDKHADPDHDGIVNLMEFALGLNPLVGNTTGKPCVTLTNGHLALTYREQRGGIGTVGVDYAIGGLIYAVEVSPDLTPGSWSSGTNLVEWIPGSRVDNGDGTENVTVQMKAGALTQPCQFMRLRVTDTAAP